MAQRFPLRFSEEEFSNGPESGRGSFKKYKNIDFFFGGQNSLKYFFLSNCLL
jgi:hypothetical protein